MEPYRFTLFEDRFGPGGAVEYLTPGANRVLYCVEGSVGLGSHLGEGFALNRQQASGAPGRARVETGIGGALLMRWELTPAEIDDEVEGSGVTAREMLAGELYLPSGDGAVMRLESISLPPGGGAPYESHPGPSIRVLTEGAMDIVENEGRRRIGPGDAWFDIGGGPSVGHIPDDKQPLSFLRLILLPEDYAGRDSIRLLVEATNGEAPLDYEILLDEVIDY